MKRREEEVEFKNKLYRHHKSKFSFVVRNFSLTFIGIFTVLGGIAIPTYISVSNTLQIQTQAVEETLENGGNKNDSKNSEENDQNVEDDKSENDTEKEGN